jgi:hypothetical protein
MPLFACFSWSFAYGKTPIPKTSMDAGFGKIVRKLLIDKF